MSQNRFEFPGFAFKQALDTDTHEVEVGTLKDGEKTFVITLIRNKQFSFLSFGVSKIEAEDGKVLWTFQSQNHKGVGLLVHVEGQSVIALCSPGRDGKVQQVIPLSSLSGVVFGILKLTKLKESAAESLNRTFELSPTEQKVQARENQKVNLEAAARAAAEEAARQAEIKRREDERIRRVRRLLARDKVFCYSADGRERYGIPVLESEWPSVSNGTYVITVTSVDDEIGDPIEGFKVSKETGKNPKKEHPVSVTRERPLARVREAAAAGITKPVNEIAIQIGDDYQSVQLFPSWEAVQNARKAGLNGGTYVASADKRGAGNKYQIFAVHHDGIKSVGDFEAI